MGNVLGFLGTSRIPVGRPGSESEGGALVDPTGCAVGRKMGPKGIHVLIQEICEYGMLHGRGN